MFVGCIAFSGKTTSPKAACGRGGGGGCMGTLYSLHSCQDVETCCTAHEDDSSNVPGRRKLQLGFLLCVIIIKRFVSSKGTEVIPSPCRMLNLPHLETCLLRRSAAVRAT